MPEPDPLPTIKTPWGSATPPFGSSPGDVPPIPIPDHTLIRRVGKGSYGEVWLARNVLGVYRAVKIIHRGSFDDDRPFEREFAGMQRFEPVSRSHESQLNILQVGRGADCFYYVMELADAMGRGAAIDEGSYTPRNLRSELLLRGRLPVDECIRLGLALTTALENLHRHGLVHRDIKPSNIVFVNGIPKLADIGLVALAESTMSFVGTEGYLPPEGPGTVQADLFSLGKVLYEISTGRDRQQFPELPTGITELPDRAALAELNEVLLRACAPDVKQRYETAAEMHADLALLQSGKSVARTRAVERRLRFVVRAGAVMTAIAALAGGAFLYQQMQTREARRLAEDNRQLAEEKTQLADDKSRLAGEKTKLAEENRQRLARLDVANGVRLMDQDDYSGALLWLSEALPLVTNSPAEEAIHRIRIQQVLNQAPRLLQVVAHGASVFSGAFSPDGRRVVTGTANGNLRILDADLGTLLIGPLTLSLPILEVHFTKDGRRLFARSCSDQGLATRRRETDGMAAVIDAATGQTVFPSVSNAVRTAFSPDDRWLAIAQANNAINLLDATDGESLAAMTGHTNEITMLSFSRDGNLLASASRDRTVRLWRVPSGEPIGRPIRHEQEVVRAIFSPDARRLATATEAPPGGKKCFIHTWEVAGGTQVNSPIEAASHVFALAYDQATGRRLLGDEGKNWVSVWDADSHATICPPLGFESSSPRCWAFSPDGLRFAAGSDDGTARVWNLETGEPLTPRFRHGGWVESVNFSPDGTRLLTASDDGTAKIWDLATLPETPKPLRLGSHMALMDPVSCSSSLSPDGRHLLVSADDRTLRLVDLDTLTEEGAPLPAPDGNLAGVVRFDSSGRQWAAALGPFNANGRPQTVGLWRREKDRTVHFDLPHDVGVREVAFDPSGAALFTSSGNTAWSWNTADGNLNRKAPLPDHAHLHLEFGTGVGGSSVVAHLEDDSFRLFDLANWQWTGPPVEVQQVQRFQFSPDKTRLASVGADQCGRIWDMLNGKALTPPFKHGGNLHWVEWSPDGGRVVTSGLSGEAKLWDAATGEPLLGPMGVQGSVKVAHFSPDGRFLVTRGDDHTARVWDAATSEPVTPILHHAAEVWVAMLTARNRLVTLSNPDLVRTWDLVETRLPATLIADYARLLAGRKLDRAGVVHTLKAAEISELHQAMRASAPSFFTTDKKRLHEWHRRRLPELTSLAEVTAAAFHLDHLAELDPSDAELEELRAKVGTCRIPARDPNAPASLVDLSEVYTHSFGVLPQQEFLDLPRGLQKLGGVPFDLRGLVRLERADSEDVLASFRCPEIRNLRVGRRCRQLHFLQACDGAAGTDGAEVARWVVHFADGSVREWPVVYGEQIGDWWGDRDTPKEPTQAPIVWEGHPPIPTKAGAASVRLFKATWTNPQPAIEITHLDFILGKAQVRPFVVAITAD